LRALRRRIADEHDVAAYIIFSDVALREMANRYPANVEEFARISGVGKQKLEAYAEPFIDEIAAYLRTYPRQIFEDSFTVPEPPKPKARSRSALNDTTRETLRLFRSGIKVADIAQLRGFVTGTIYGHLLAAAEHGEALSLTELFSVEEQHLLSAALEKAMGHLGTAKELLGTRGDYGALRLYLALRGKTA